MHAKSIIVAMLLACLLSGCFYSQSGEDLVHAAAFDSVEDVDRMISAGADINYRAFDAGETPLVVAVINGRIDMAEHLLAKGADINIADAGGTPLFWAFFKGHIELAKLIITRGGKLAVTSDKDNKWLLSQIEQYKNPELTALVNRVIEHEKSGE